MIGRRSYDGDAIDAGYQSIDEAPFYNDGETVDVVDDEPVGEERTTNVPDLQERPDVEGQSTWSDWGGDER
jgi:hypothetical protein